MALFSWDYKYFFYHYPFEDFYGSATENDHEEQMEDYGRTFENTDEFDEFIGYSINDEIIKAAPTGVSYYDDRIGSTYFLSAEDMKEVVRVLKNLTLPDGPGLVSDGFQWSAEYKGQIIPNEMIDRGEGFPSDKEIDAIEAEYPTEEELTPIEGAI